MSLSGVRVLVVDTDEQRGARWSQELQDGGAVCETRSRPGQGLEALLLSAASPTPYAVVVLGPTVPTAMADAFQHTMVGSMSSCKLVVVTPRPPAAPASLARRTVLLPAGEPEPVGLLLAAVADALSGTLPHPAKQSAPPDDHTGAAASGDALRILLAEDNPVNQEVAEAALEAPGWQVTSVVNGLEAVAAVRSGDFHAVVMDIQMPELDGLAATRSIRELPSPRCHVPIVAMTANALAVHRTAAREAGMDGFVPKPISAQELVSTVRRAIERAGPTAAASPSPTETACEVNEVIDLAVLGALQATFGPALSRVHATLAKDAPMRLERMQQAALVSDFTILEREAHSLKSSSGTFGLVRVSVLCKTIEYACHEERHDDARSALATLESLLPRHLATLADHM